MRKVPEPRTLYRCQIGRTTEKGASKIEQRTRAVRLSHFQNGRSSPFERPCIRVLHCRTPETNPGMTSNSTSIQYSSDSKDRSAVSQTWSTKIERIATSIGNNVIEVCIHAIMASTTSIAPTAMRSTLIHSASSWEHFSEHPRELRRTCSHHHRSVG